MAELSSPKQLYSSLYIACADLCSKNSNTIDNAAAQNLIVHINDTIAQTLTTTEKTGFHASVFYAIQIIVCMDFLTHHSKIDLW